MPLFSVCSVCHVRAHAFVCRGGAHVRSQHVARHSPGRAPGLARNGLGRWTLTFAMAMALVVGLDARAPGRAACRASINPWPTPPPSGTKSTMMTTGRSSFEAKDIIPIVLPLIARSWAT